MKKLSLFSCLASAWLGLVPACEGESAPMKPPSAVADSGPDADAADAAEDAASEDAGRGSEVVRLVGAVDDSDIRVGVVADDKFARLFFCGGDSSYSTATRWLELSLEGDGSFEYDEMEWRVTGRLDAGGLEGSWREGDGESREFSAEPVRSGTLAGLYEGAAECGRLGLIVTQPRRGSAASGQGACVRAGRPTEQVHPILPIARTGGEIRVEVDGVETGVRPAGSPR